MCSTDYKKNSTFNFIYLTLFPELFRVYFRTSMAKKSLQKNHLSYKVYDIRNWAIRGHADDYMYGGGTGMIIKIDCLVKALASVYEEYGKNCHIVLLSPQGNKFTQKDVTRLTDNTKNLVFICGHYEGIDERIINYVDEQLSIGDFVTSGGEIPALTITDSIIRALPGFMSPEAYQSETHQLDNKFDFASYTRPPVFENQKVPEILLSGNHQKIKEWREKNSEEKFKNKKNCFQNKIVPDANKWRLSLFFSKTKKK